MAERSGIDALTAGPRAEFGPPVEERIALNVDPEQMSARQLLASVKFLQAEVKRLRPALERLIPAAHDFNSTLCRERAARQEALSPCQRRPAEWDDECPACVAQAELRSGVRRG